MWKMILCAALVASCAPVGEEKMAPAEELAGVPGNVGALVDGQAYALNNINGTVEANAMLFCTCTGWYYNVNLIVLDLASGSEKMSYSLATGYQSIESCTTALNENPLCQNPLVFKLVQ